MSRKIVPGKRVPSQWQTVSAFAFASVRQFFRTLLAAIDACMVYSSWGINYTIWIVRCAAANRQILVRQRVRAPNRAAIVGIFAHQPFDSLPVAIVAFRESERGRQRAKEGNRMCVRERETKCDKMDECGEWMRKSNKIFTHKINGTRSNYWHSRTDQRHHSPWHQCVHNKDDEHADGYTNECIAN